LVKYITRYVRENYDVVKLRKDIAMQLREYAKKMGFTINDAVSYLLTNMQSDVVNQVSTEVSEYVLNNYKLIKDILPNHYLEEIKTFLSMKKVDGERRPEFKYLIAHDIMIPSKPVQTYFIPIF